MAGEHSVENRRIGEFIRRFGKVLSIFSQSAKPKARLARSPAEILNFITRVKDCPGIKTFLGRDKRRSEYIAFSVPVNQRGHRLRADTPQKKPGYKIAAENDIPSANLYSMRLYSRTSNRT
jgi:hypothetical protein